MSAIPANPNSDLRRLNPHLYPSLHSEGDSEMARDGQCRNERQLHSAILAECRSRGWIALHGSMASPTRRVEGEPDFLIMRDCGRILFVECKTATGKLSVEQQQFMVHAKKLGHTVYVVRSMEEFKNLL